MMRAWHLIPLLILASLGAAIYSWQIQQNRWQPPAALATQLPQQPTPPQAETANIAPALARPLLWATRKPLAKKEPKDNKLQELMQSRLVAVFESGPERVAILKRPDGSVYQLTPHSQPWRIEAFDGHKARFTTQDGTQRAEHFLQNSKP